MFNNRISCRLFHSNALTNKKDSQESFFIRNDIDNNIYFAIVIETKGEIMEIEKKKRKRNKNENVKTYLARIPKGLFAELESLGETKGLAVNKLLIFACRDYLEKTI